MNKKGQLLKINEDPAGVPQLQGENLAALRSYIRNSHFKGLLNTLVRAQAETSFKSISVLSRDFEADKSIFISALALAYTCYLQSKVLIVETVEQPTDRALFMKSILGEHAPEGEVPWGSKGGCVDFLSTENFFDGERELADFHLGEYIREVQPKYDLVLVDTAPLSRTDDDAIHPLIISGFTDQSILVVRSQRKALKEINDTLKMLRANNVPLLGIVEDGQRKGRYR